MRTSWPTSVGGIPQEAKLRDAGRRLGIPRASKKPTKRRFVRYLIRSARPTPPLPIRPLLEQVRWTPKRYPERNPESWVLQPTLRGPVWRYERWADRHKDVYAVAVLGTPAGPGDRRTKAVPKPAPRPDDPT